MSRKFWIATAALALTGGLLPGAPVRADDKGTKVSGKVTWEGAIPERRKLEVNKDNEKCECDAKSGAKQAFKLDESLIVDASTKGVANCVVFLKGASGGPTLGPAQIDQKGCMFSPHVSVITKGQAVKVLNPDKIAHNFHWISKDNPSDNKTIARFKPFLDTPAFDKPEFIKVVCDIHLWMGGWVAVMDNGYVGLTDEKGGFSIAGLPPGKYKLACWHEPLSAEGSPILMEKDLTVEAGKDASMDFSLSAK